MTSRKKPRNNARNSAARAVQRETGLRYKQALAVVADQPPATRIITAPGLDAMAGSLRAYGLGLTAFDAAATVWVRAEPAHQPVPYWRLAASGVLSELSRELADWQHAAGFPTIVLPEGQPVRMKVPVNATLKSSPDRWLTEPLTDQDRDGQWAQALLGQLTALRQQLLPFHGASVDDVRSVIDRLEHWLTGQ